MKTRLSDNHVRIRLEPTDRHRLEAEGALSCRISISPSDEFAVSLKSDVSGSDGISVELTDSGILIGVSGQMLQSLLNGEISELKREKSSHQCGVSIEVDIQ